ncbi:MAG: hypothetical protein IPJ41_09685 [Phycisphaerales bacterium]|nr:hypothetical protein [Phycisphaerales bacterium]
MSAALPRVLLLESLHADAEAMLGSAATVARAASTDEASGLAGAGSGPVDAVITRGKARVTPALMDAARGLRVIARAGVGLDNVDVAGRRRGASRC